MRRSSLKIVKFKRDRPASRRQGRRPRLDWRLLIACLAVFTVVFAAGLLWQNAEPSVDGPPGDSVRVVRVIDGDTFEIAGGERVRILNIDTAEMPPRSKCDKEADLARAAKARLRELVRQSDEITLAGAGRDRDQYGRQLRLVRVDGRDVGDILVGEGLAQPWRGRRASWC